MNFEAKRLAQRASQGFLAIVLIASMAGCASVSEMMGNAWTGLFGAAKPKPLPLPANVVLLAVRQSWTARIGEIRYPLDVHVLGNTVTLASSSGNVVALDASTGREQWRVAVGAPVVAGVGSDGTTAAVVTEASEVVAIEGGKVAWRQKLPAQGSTAPLVAGARVFVLTSDRAVSAFDGKTGKPLWTQGRPAEALVLRQGGVMQAVGDTLVVGLSGRMVGLNPLNGSVRWEAAIAAPRGTNDVERLVDLVARTSREGDVVCARAFQTAVGCVDAGRGTLLWTKPASGGVGIHGDRTQLYGAESDGRVLAWKRSDGERAWISSRLLHRKLTAPLAAGRSVIVGDDDGTLHLFSREDGSALNRVATDSSGVVAAPVMAGNTLVAVTRNGGVFGFVPE